MTGTHVLGHGKYLCCVCPLEPLQLPKLPKLWRGPSTAESAGAGASSAQHFLCACEEVGLRVEWKSQESCAPDLWWFLCILLPWYFNWYRASLGTWKWCFSVDTTYRPLQSQANKPLHYQVLTIVTESLTHCTNCLFFTVDFIPHIVYMVIYWNFRFFSNLLVKHVILIKFLFYNVISMFY
jgi:hypothetical protein